ncbi:MAG: glycosyltransferase [Candidatus Levybacteria bacterium]|nr:glycosyltransferase [Candidatus Levybacteria bacterium]
MKDLNLLVIGSYPPFGTIHDKAIVGGGSYTKNTLLSLVRQAKKQNITADITVLAEKLDEKTSYLDEEIKVERVWKKNNLLAFWRLWKSIKSSKTKDILFTFEFSMFGSLLYLLPLPLFLIGIKLRGKRLHVVLHQVITDASSMSGHLNIPQKSLKTTLYTLLFQAFYHMITSVSTRVIVFEEIFKKRLGNKSHIVVIPHGVEKIHLSLSQSEARKKLGLPLNKKIVLCFGFLAWYKGSDWIASLFASVDALSDTVLVIAGGPNNNHLSKPFYQKYIADVEAKRSDNIHITGFVDEKNLPLYFKACDLTLFPYRTLMASSGPLSFTFSLSTPFLLSDKLSDLALTWDFADALQKENLFMHDLVFPLQKQAASIIDITLSDTVKLQKLQQLSSRLQEKRLWNTIADHYLEILVS